MKDDVEHISEIFKALSDPTRLSLIVLLSKCQPTAGEGVCDGGPLCVNALAHQLGVSQSAVSQHLRILRQAGLVSGTRKGTFMHYVLNPDGLNQCREALLEILGDDVTAD